ncbi:MAG TPA: hypothetical protein VF611_05755 [Pyrinomonadaceae bacterium]
MTFKIDPQQIVQSLLDSGDNLTRADNPAQNVAEQTSDSGVFEVRFAGNNLRFNLERQVASAAQVAGQAVGLFASGAPAAPAAAQVDEDKVEEVVFRARGFDGGTTLAYALGDPELLNEAERDEVVRRIVGLGQEGADILTRYAFQEPRNVVYDQQQVVARAVADAHRRGAVTDADLGGLLEAGGEDASAQLILTLASDPSNVRNNGLVEALGRQAEALGFREAADIAFSSSETLINEHLRTPADRRRAAEAVGERVGSLDETHERENIYGEHPQARAELSQLLGNAARLSARGDGYTRDEFRGLVEGLGPGLVNEVVARLTKVGGDDGARGALDLLGDVSRDLAAQTTDDEQADWRVNADIAHTQSRALINANFTSDGEAVAAFDRLNARLVELRETAAQGAYHGYTLLQQPAVTEALTTLLEARGGAILDAKLDTVPDAPGQADLVQLFQSTLFSPFTPAPVRDRIGAVLDDYVRSETRGAGNDTGRVGRNVGELFGTLQFAARRGVEDARDEDVSPSGVESFARSFIPRLFGIAAGAGVSALTSPVGGQLANAVVSAVFTEVFKADPPTPGELEEAFIEQFERLGYDLNVGEAGVDGLNQVFDVAIRRLNDALDLATTQDERNRIQRAINLAEQLNSTSNDGFQNTVDSDQLGRELDRRE